MRSRLIIPTLRHSYNARAHYANVLIDQLQRSPTPELMDKIEALLWGRTFGSSLPQLHTPEDK